MTFTKLLFTLAFVLPAPLMAQTITVKLTPGPLQALGGLHWSELVPLTFGASVEVGVSPKSSFQINGLYRIGDESHGPKYYVDYRYYVKPQKQNNSGFYISPFLGISHQRVTSDEDFDGIIKDHFINGKSTGVLIGYQPYRKSSRFTVDIYAGPEYQWRVEKYSFNDFANRPSYQLSSNRTWFRAGINFCFRIKR